MINRYSNLESWALCAWVFFEFLRLPVCASSAFPGAEGFGAEAAGGRGGTVYHVINLNDSGPGSLRTGLSAANRTIVFDVSGTIRLASDLKVTRTNITIAGQTAPGDGIALMGRLFSVENTHDVIVRYLRCRPGDTNCPAFQDDSFHFVSATNCIADHVTASWAIDECLSCTWSTNISVQWCIIGASLDCSCHVKGCHGYGSLLRYGAGRVTYHHNFYVHNQNRNPRPGDNIHLDFVNNLVYDWGSNAGYNEDDTADNPGGFTNELNYVGNVFLAGPSSASHLTLAFSSGVGSATRCEIYQSGNWIDGNRNGILDGSDTGWSMFSGLCTRETVPFPAPPVTTDSSSVAYERVLAFAGASASRDAVDQLVVANARQQTGNIINSETEQGGWPVLSSSPAATDTDQDGIPDYWELAMGWNPAVANNNHTNSDGYTDLEWYLNWLADPHAVCDRNGSVDVDLWRAAGSSTNLEYSVASGTNGAVSLLGDGHTARFAAASNYSGPANFYFSAIDPVTGAGFGPVNVGVLVSTTNAPAVNTPPVLSAIPDRTIIAGATLQFTNSASDTDQPPQALSFSLLNAPSGAEVDPTNGVFNWRPAIAQAGSSNSMQVVVTDNGSPNLSATQGFGVQVDFPALPLIGMAGFSNGLFGLNVDGDAGPDYIVQTSTNLVDWAEVFTNSAAAPPFGWSDPASNFSRRFYRIRLGP